MKNNKQILSVIVPAYKQEKTIKKDLENIDSVLKAGLGNDFLYEIICVVDGFYDSTFKEAKKVKSESIKIFGYEINHGKGYAVRFGMEKAKGDLVSFLDAGMDISPNGIMMLLTHLKWYDADIIVGSKRHPASLVNYPLKRYILSIGYHLGIKILFGLPLTDTQSGIKIFKKEVVKKVLPKLTIEGYGMDIEFLVVAKHLGFNRIYEAPIEVVFNKEASAIKWSTSFRMAWEAILVFYRLKILHSYD